MTEQQEKEITDQYLRRNLHDMLGLINDAVAQAESRVRGETVAEILAALPDELEKGTPRGNQDEYSLGFNEYREKILALLSSKQNPSSPPNEL